MIIIKRGLVLEGGGPRGAYHVGAYKALLEYDIEFDGVTGTSIGAINGAMIAQGDFDKCYDLWQDVSYDKFINLDGEGIEELEKLNFNVDSIFSLRHRLKDVISNRGFDITPLKNLLNDNINEEKLRKSEMDFGLVTVNLSDMKTMELFKEDIPEGQMKDFILASAYLPAFKAEKLNDSYYLDGAFSDNLPYSMLQRKGYEEFVLVRTHATGIVKKFNERHLNALVIAPSQDLGKTYDYSKELALRNVEMGYYDAIRILGNYKGRIYTVENTWDEDRYFELICNLSDKKVDEIRKIGHVEEIPRKRAIFELVIPKLSDYLKLEKNYNYSDFVVALLEKRAKDLGINEFKIYSIEEFYRIIKDKSIGDINLRIKEDEEKEIGTIDYIISRTELDTIFNMEKITNQIIDIILKDEDILLLE